ncbi:flagellar biosynthetic protein FliO [Nocardioides sp. Kera G14]|uniref:flagellar biosynthetic protein FliO n=1 Tax=Nocardioides sp. Kera G14 TaxID=2884264 RepID=UPI001D10F459|nr:flagellar biosynthetic protein FliO [Nocardioides sp. Kera G14]UDY24055.1 flagellar biosynthetic protein FliO [Nocardioides sp. Kera G14]
MLGSSSEGAGLDDTIGLVLRLVFSLALVLGLLLLIAKFANRRFKGRSGAAIQVVHRQQLSRSSSVAVVTVGTRVLVLGSTEQQVTLLTEVEPDEVGLDPDTMLPEDQPSQHAERATAPLRKGASFRPHGPLGGSILSPDTWRQTWAQLRGEVDRAVDVPDEKQAS